MTHCCISEFSKENLADSRDVRVFVSQQWTKRGFSIKSYTETLNGAQQWLNQGRCLEARPPLIFGPTEARRAKKKIWRPFPPSSSPPTFISVSGWLGPSPYLKVWIRLWSDWLKICFTQWDALISVFFSSGYSLYSNLKKQFNIGLIYWD